MKNEKQIRDLLFDYLNDERIHYKPALVQINAPLALIQVDLNARIRTLEWILDEKQTPLMKG